MPLPETVRVKLSSEEAGAISITPVVVQDFSMRELLEHILGITGKEEERIREILLRGSLVTGASRFRWDGWEPDLSGLRALLATFPDPDPSRPFAAGQCVRAILRRGLHAVDIPREAAIRARLLQSGSFWDLLMEVTAAAELRYAGYSYREHADRYVRKFTTAEAERIRAASSRVKFSTLRDQILRAQFREAEFLVVRSNE